MRGEQGGAPIRLFSSHQKINRSTRECYGKPCSFTGGASEFDPAVVSKNDFLYEGEAQAGSMRLCGKEGNEDFRSDVFGHPVAIVLDDNTDGAPLHRVHRNLDYTIPVERL